jgi:hypothetical protein
MNVKELITHLKIMDQNLPVFYVMFDDGYNTTELTPDDVIQTTLEDKDGKEVECIALGEGWLC